MSMWTALLIPWVVSAAPKVPASWPEPLRAPAALISPSAILAHTRFLAHDLLDGRGPGSRGGEIAMAYIASVFERLGLEPAGDGGTYFQRFDILGKNTMATGVRFEAPQSGPHAKGAPIAVAPGKSGVLAIGDEAPATNIQQAEIIFVGYGITAPEERWDDFKDVDVAGKILLVMNSDPASDPKRFAGKTRLYYGRWTYKFEEAARRKALGAIVIHTNESAGYPWQVVETSWSGEQFSLPLRPTQPRLPLEMWVTDEVARAAAKLGGHNLDKLRAMAESNTFRPVALGTRLSADLKTAIRKVSTANVLGRLPGRDRAKSGEQIVFTAHHDHLGVGQAKAGDKIYNGALDNASGVAMLLNVAEALVEARSAPKRTLLFAAVGAEESGLLGSEHLSAHPPVDPSRLVANLNVDGINIWGRTRDVTLLGLGKTTIDSVLRPLASAQGRTLVPDAFPDRGFFYRSDQFNFARIGVPAVNVSHGLDFIGRPHGWGREQVEAWERVHYHQPSDQVTPAWNLAGACEDAQLLLALGLQLANAKSGPTWTPGDEFEAIRKRSQAASPAPSPTK